MYTLAIEDIVEVPVKFTLKVRKVNKQFAFTLLCTRLEQEEIASRMQELEFKFKDFMQSPELVSGWEDQRLVLGDDGQPATFSAEALSMLLKTQGVAKVCFDAYTRECGAKEKN